MKKYLIAAVLAATSTLAATAASASTYWVKYGITLNARSGPGTYYDVIGKFHSCNAVNVVDYQNGWAKISYNGYNYWVSSRYLQQHKCGYQAPKKKSYSSGGGGY